MPRFLLASLSRALVLATCASTSLTSAGAHEAHKMECNETTINAMNADVQSMDDGNAKTTALKEMEIAEQMMANNDAKGCEAHMHKAMEAMEK